jgi:hypothetical protein
MPSPTTDSRVADFVRGLALAWKNLAQYPHGHPILAGALDSVHARLRELLGPLQEAIFGVAADGLLYGDVKVESLYAQKLAHALHLRGVALVRFTAAATPDEIGLFLGLVGPSSTRPLADELTEVHRASKRVNAATYDAPDCLDEDEDDDEEQLTLAM